MKWIVSLCVTIIVASTVQAEPVLVLEHVTVLDPQGSGWLQDRAILMSDGRIEKIAESGTVTAPTGARTMDLAGLFVVPGLIDLHTHLLLHPYDETVWDDQVLRESLEKRTLRAGVAAGKTLQAGWTTLRELGTEGAGYADVALRDAIAEGMIPGPRLFVATRAIVAVGCYGPAGFDWRWDVPQGAQEANGADGMRAVVREQIAGGADWVKIYADFPRRRGGPATPTLTREEIAAAVDEARAAGLPVAAHAETSEAIRRCAESGVATIEHGYKVDEAGLKAMRAHGVAFCPTLAANEAMARYAGWERGQPEPERLRQARAVFAMALRTGVQVACGSDAGVFPHGDNTRELELMVEYGMTPAQALKAATLVAAQVLRQDDLGRLAAGAAADLIAVPADPLRDIAALRRVVLVVQAGHVVKDSR